MPVGVTTLPLAFFTPGPSEMLLVAVIALLVFGKDLPSVAKQWGKAFQEFRRVLLKIDGTGTIEFDVKKRKFLRSEYRGEVEISSKTSSLRGTGKIEMTTEIAPAAVSAAPER